MKTILTIFIYWTLLAISLAINLYSAYLTKKERRMYRDALERMQNSEHQRLLRKYGVVKLNEVVRLKIK